MKHSSGFPLLHPMKLKFHGDPVLLLGLKSSDSLLPFDSIFGK